METGTLEGETAEDIAVHSEMVDRYAIAQDVDRYAVAQDNDQAAHGNF